LFGGVDMPYTRITSKNIEDNTVDTVDIKDGAVTVDKINIDKDLSANGHKITGLADPTNNSDAATKAYVDAHTSNQLPPATSGQTLRYNGTAWVANSNLYNDGTNIGIGTTNPGAKLDVSGDIKTDELTVQGLKIITKGSFTVGGNSTSYYPVRFRNDAPGTSVPSRLMIYRSNVHTDGSWYGTFQLEISFHPSNWGHFLGQIEKIIYQTGAGSPYNDPVGDIADGSLNGSGDDLIVWLKGGATYEWRNLDVTGPWTLIDGNPGGTSITDSSGNIRNPITSQSTLILNAKNKFYTNALGLGTTQSGYFGSNVGIGTTSPTEKLHVVGNIRHTGSLIGGTTYAKTWMKMPSEDSYGNMLALDAGGTTILGSGESVDAVAPNFGANDEVLILSSDNDIKFITNLQNGWNSRVDAMTISSSGNVGIGTISPQQRLTLSSNFNFAVEMSVPTGVAASTSTNGTLNGTYYYKVSASDGSGWTTLSSEVSATVDGGTTAGTINVSWNAVQGATKYRVWRGTSSGGENQYYETTSTSISDNGSLTFTSGTPPTVTTAYVNKITSSGNSWFLGGNVGIGTTNPGSLLSLYNATTTKYAMNITSFQELDDNSSNSAAGQYIPKGTTLYLGSNNPLNNGRILIYFTQPNTSGMWTGAYIGSVVGDTSNGGSHIVFGRRTGANTWAETMKIDKIGNVGIGTTSPSEKLHVVGNIGISAGANAFIGTKDNYALSLRTNNNDRVYITNDGNVGIGTTNPGAKLDINGNGIPVSITYSALNPGNKLQIVEGSQWGMTGVVGVSLRAPYAYSSGISYGYQTDLIKWDGRNLSLAVDRDGDSAKNGNVGIGTTNPQQRLTLSSNSNFAVEMSVPTGVAASTSTNGTLNGTYYYKVSASDGSGWTTLSSEVSATVDGGTTAGTINVSWNAVQGATKYRVWRGTSSGGENQYYETTSTSISDDGSLTFTSGTPPTVTTAYVNKITSSGNSWFLGGNVGIGTTTPGAKLQVTGAVNINGQMTTAILGNSYNYWTTFGGATGGRIRGESTEGYLVLDGNPSGTNPRVLINYASSGNVIIAYGGGNVGIGTTSPSEKLDVVGNIRLSGNLLIGNGTIGDKTIIANNADTNKPKIRYNDTSKKWEFTNDGTTWKSISDEIVYYEDTFTGDGTTKTFALSNTPILSSVFVIRNGIVLKSGVDYTISGNTITFTESPANGSLITVKYNKTIATTSEVVNQFLGNNNTWSGVNTFVNDVNANNIKINGYIKQEFPTSSLSATGTIITITAGENLSAGDVLKIGVDGKYYKANASYNTGVPAVALAIENISASYTGRALVKGYWLDTSKNYQVGKDIYLATVAGGITQTPPTSDGNQIQKLGIALTNNLIEFNPDQTYMEYKAIPYRVDLTNAITDYLLQVGEEAIIYFSNTTIVPLHIQTQDGTYYEISILPSNNAGTSEGTSNPIFLNPNNTTYSNAFKYAEILRNMNVLLSSYSTFSSFRIAGVISKIKLFLENTVTFKSINGIATTYGISSDDSTINCFSSTWMDITTQWTSLGTITFPQNTSGYILVRRLQ
jgi:hypothetical protein